jgi:hypothetical protein
VEIPICCNKFLSILKTPVVSTENLNQSPDDNTELVVWVKIDWQKKLMTRSTIDLFIFVFKERK